MRRIISLLLLFALSCSGAAAVNKRSTTVPVTAVSWLVSTDSGQIIQGKNTQLSRSIASITKLMTAMVVLNSGQDLDQLITDPRLGSHSRRELIQMAMIKSNNAAAYSLCEHYTGGVTECVKAMNQQAQALGMINTKFVDPTGLGIMNISTAEDLVKMTSAAQYYPELVQASNTAVLKISNQNKLQILHNTNPAVARRQDLVISKTGYIKAAGGCVVMMVKQGELSKIVVVLGSQTTRTRIPEAELLIARN
jgi:D-alanyl-D-alanine endopeptidase (penicillin-binding protein 7)